MHPLKDMIYRKGFTIRQFCLISGIDKVTLYKIFNGETKKVRPDTIYKMSNVLNLDYGTVAGLTEGI